MKLIKKLLVGLGVVFLAVLLLAGSLLYLGSRFKGEHEPFVREFLTDYSRRWDVADVHGRLADEYLEQVRGPDGEHVVGLFRQLGRVLEISDVSLENFYAGTEGSSGTFIIATRFEAAPAVVRLTLRAADSRVQVIGLYVTPSTDLLPRASSPTEI